jgi:hypothetical protein
MTHHATATPRPGAAAAIQLPQLIHLGLQWLILSAAPVLLLWLLHERLMAFWQWVVSAWSGALGLALSTRLSAQGDALIWTATGDGSFAPSLTHIATTAVLAVAVWLWSARFSDRFHPLKISLRALCLIQWSACLFFWLAPASFPYTISSHASALMGMGFGFMLAIGPMLALGWGILRTPLLHKILAPVAFLAYFALMLPHKTLLQVWLLEHLSILFMPVLFLCFGALLDLWIFVALYAWLASTTPTLAQAGLSAGLGGAASLHPGTPPLDPLRQSAP